MKALQEAIDNAKKLEAETVAAQAQDTGTDAVNVVKDAEEIIEDVLAQGYPAPGDTEEKDERALALRRRVREFRKKSRAYRAKIKK